MSNQYQQYVQEVTEKLEQLVEGNSKLSTIFKSKKSLSSDSQKALKAYLEYRDADYNIRDQKKHALIEILNKNNPTDLVEVFNRYFHPVFEIVANTEVANKLAKVAGRLTDYVYSFSSYRRSFRTKDIQFYIETFIGQLNTLFFPWKDFNMASYLSTPSNEDDPKMASILFSDLLALEIDEKNQAVIDAVKDICLGDNNTQLLSHDIVRAMVRCNDPEIHKLLCDLLLAARLQEGLRQVILENADCGRVEALQMLMKTVLDNNLLRYSSAMRAVGTWMGLGYEYEDKRVIEKVTRLGYTYLLDADARSAAITSNDVIEMYAALWSISVYELQDLMTSLEQLMKGKKYQQLVALYFFRLLENLEQQTKIATRYLDETDLDVLAYVMSLYNVSFGWAYNQKDFQKNCQSNNPILQDKKVRDEHFDKLMKIVKIIPPKGHTVSQKPFEWTSCQLNPESIFSSLLAITGYDFDCDKIAALIDVMDSCDSNNRMRLIQFIIATPNNDKERTYLFKCLNDKSMAVRQQAVKNIEKMQLSDTELLQIQDLMKLKTGDLRQNVMKIILNQEEGQTLAAVKSLVSDKVVEKRLGGLDMLSQLVKQEKLSRAAASEFIAAMPTVTDREQILVDQLLSEEVAYNSENGFGMYDPNVRPSFPPLQRDENHTLTSLFSMDLKRFQQLFDSLVTKIIAHKEATFKQINYDDSEIDVVFGTVRWLPKIANQDNSAPPSLDDFPLAEVWRAWIKENNVQLEEIYYFRFLDSMKNWQFDYTLQYKELSHLIEKHFQYKKACDSLDYVAKKEYAGLAIQIMKVLLLEFSNEEQFVLISGALIDLMQSVSEEEWSKTYVEKSSNYRGEYTTKYKFADSQEVQFLLNSLNSDVEDEQFKKYLAICYQLGRLSGLTSYRISEVDVARGVTLDVIPKDLLYRILFLQNPVGQMRSYTGNLGKFQKECLEKYPILKEAIAEIVTRVIEIELKRGDSETPTSPMAKAIYYHEGAETFTGLLVALGNETFTRGYSYYSGGYTKKDVLSSLLKACHPSKDDTAATMKQALNGRIKDKRLLEAAMYSPSWIKYVGELLGWKGLESASWYFHAHTNDSFSAEKETEIARYSPITPEEFNDGAFDIDWFKDAYKTLGKAKFEMLYDCAKYLSDGTSHRRAQLYADATLGKLKLPEIMKEIKSKRNQDKLRSMSLIPLKKDKAADALKRYEFIQAFLKESKQFGAQRRASEAKAANIALENLARNMGYQDVLRFSWSMETLKMQQLTKYFEPVNVEGADISIHISDAGIAEMVCVKDGKQLKSVPAKLKKHKLIVEYKEVIISLKNQFKRAKASLEKSMENQDTFLCTELQALMDHPVIAPLLGKLVFRSDDEVGFFREGALVDAEGNTIQLDGATELSIAHSFHLYKSGKWSKFQRYAFENELLQPFKQIFRELYLINDDEASEKVKSRRYAGHQVQPKKTVALLKSRGWTVDYENGLQKVYYKENIIATIYAMADWFSPSDIESPTLETVQFFDRKDYGTKPFEEISPVLFSEIMRDVDLVVSVAHVGGVDPEASHSTVEMRASIVAELLSLLKVDNVTVKDRHAIIQGSLGEYTVHLGSGGVHKMGKGAVNILAVQSQHRGRIFLPFADEDPRTAEIMSKILLLADDKTIKDPNILSQLK